MKRKFIVQFILLSYLFFFFVLSVGAQSSSSLNLKRIAQIPFVIHSDRDMSYVRNGIINMMYARLSWQDHVIVLPQDFVDSELKGLEGLSESEKAANIAVRTESDYVLAGSITKIGEGFSIDARIFDVSRNRYMPFFVQSTDERGMIAQLDLIAALINQKVFERTTPVLDKIQYKKQEKFTDMKRKNPEHMMQNTVWQKEGTEEKFPKWQIWKYIF